MSHDGVICTAVVDVLDLFKLQLLSYAPKRIFVRHEGAPTGTKRQATYAGSCAGVQWAGGPLSSYVFPDAAASNKVNCGSFDTLFKYSALQTTRG